MIPSPWVGLVLALACFRVTRLVSYDNFPPIEHARDRLLGTRVRKTGSGNAHLGVSNETMQEQTVYDRPTLAHLLHCTYCIGFWICLATYLLWIWFPTEVMYASFPFALSAAVGITSVKLDL